MILAHRLMAVGFAALAFALAVGPLRDPQGDFRTPLFYTAAVAAVAGLLLVLLGAFVPRFRRG